MEKLQALRGMNDMLPEQSPMWRGLEEAVQKVLDQYGYRELRVPIVEKTALFARSIGEVTDIVEKEMYTFEDRNGDSLTLRPEATAGMVRAGIEHGLFHNQVQRLWCIGPMFRHERPQAGRYRQFHQIDVEAFGMPGPDIDAELILLSARFFRQIGLKDISLQINSLGSTASRAAYRAILVDYFRGHHDALDEDSKRRLETNPLRILDTKNPDMKSLVTNAPVLIDHLDDGAREHFEGLRAILDDAGLSYEVNPHLVRGMDYYCNTVFEWVTDRLGAQGTVCAGGRYDGLVEHLGGKASAGIGFAMGMERLIALAGENAIFAAHVDPDVYLVAVGDEASRRAVSLAENLRDQLPTLKLQLNCGGGSFKSQMKKADRSGATLALLLGEDEIKNDQITLKPLRGQGEQSISSLAGLAEHLRSLRLIVNSQRPFMN